MFYRKSISKCLKKSIFYKKGMEEDPPYSLFDELISLKLYILDIQKVIEQGEEGVKKHLEEVEKRGTYSMSKTENFTDRLNNAKKNLPRLIKIYKEKYLEYYGNETSEDFE